LSISGEVAQSYGYGATGKSSTAGMFNSYGESFGPGDVIGCFVVSVYVCHFFVDCALLSKMELQYICLFLFIRICIVRSKILLFRRMENILESVLCLAQTFVVKCYSLMSPQRM